jgi:hypothetical protein
MKGMILLAKRSCYPIDFVTILGGGKKSHGGSHDTSWKEKNIKTQNVAALCK